MNTNQLPSSKVLLPPAKTAEISNVEKILGSQLPIELRDFLLQSDGGLMPNGRIIIYSAGQGIHPDETLLAANKGRATEEPLLFFAREAEEEFAFKCSDISRDKTPVYVYEHEEQKLKRIADSFSAFLVWAAGLPSDD